MDLLHQHVATVCQVFDPRLGNLHISLDLDVVLFEASGDFLLLEKQLFVFVALLLAFSLLLLELDRLGHFVDLGLEIVELDAAGTCRLLAVVMIFILRDDAVVLLVFGLEFLVFLGQHDALISQDISRVTFVEQPQLQVVRGPRACLLLGLELVQGFIIFLLKNRNLVGLLFIFDLLFTDLIGQHLLRLLNNAPLVVELILQSEDMLI